MKFATFAALATAVSAQANSTATNSTDEWKPIDCMTTDDCMTDDILATLNNEFAMYEVEGTMDDVICAEVSGMTDDGEEWEAMTCTLIYACDESGYEDGTTWEYDCEGASKLVAAGTAMLMLAYSM